MGVTEIEDGICELTQAEIDEEELFRTKSMLVPDHFTGINEYIENTDSEPLEVTNTETTSPNNSFDTKVKCSPQTSNEAMRICKCNCHCSNVFLENKDMRALQIHNQELRRRVEKLETATNKSEGVQNTFFFITTTWLILHTLMMLRIN